MNYKKLTNEEIESFAGVKEFNNMWYLSAAERGVNGYGSTGK